MSVPLTYPICAACSLTIAPIAEARLEKEIPLRLQIAKWND
jgi:hypothetical protein